MTVFEDQLEEDINTTFLDPEEFGTPGTYNAVREGVLGLIINGIFDDPFASAAPGTEMALQGIKPTFRIQKSDLPGGLVRPEDNVTIKGIDYLCDESRPDGVGIVLIELRKK